MADVFANNRSILHKGDGNQHVSGPPDVCKTPSPGGPVPIPYPNIAMDSNLAKGAKKVKINGNPVAHEGSNLSTSTGDEAGTAGGGILSSKFKGKLTWGSSSGDVKVEGKGVVRFMDVTEHNGNVFNTVITALGEVTVPGYGDDPLDSKDCSVCGEPKKKHRIEANKDITEKVTQLYNELIDKGGAFQAALGSDKMLQKKFNGVMIGVLVCRCKKAGYAGISGEWPQSGDDPRARMARAFSNAAGSLGLSAVTTPASPPPFSANMVNPPSNPPGPVFGRMSPQQWADIAARAQAKRDFYKAGADPLVCAAPRMIQKCLEDGHKPNKMIEMWVANRQKSVGIPERIVVTLDKSESEMRTTSEKRKADRFGDGAAVPSCVTCQVTLTGMLCHTHKAPCP